jgi:hypothetical protein
MDCFHRVRLLTSSLGRISLLHKAMLTTKQCNVCFNLQQIYIEQQMHTKIETIKVKKFIRDHNTQAPAKANRSRCYTLKAPKRWLLPRHHKSEKAGIAPNLT